MPPAGADNTVDARGPAVVVAGHFERILSDRAWDDNVVDLTSGIVIQHVVCASSRNYTLERTRHSNWIVIVISEQSRAD